MNASLFASAERIDCFPERESTYSSYSKEACLARNCLFDDNASTDVIQCFLHPNYGYILQTDIQQTEKGMRLRLRRNQAIVSMGLFKYYPCENLWHENAFSNAFRMRLKYCEKTHPNASKMKHLTRLNASADASGRVYETRLDALYIVLHN
ncbi:unnamed protein product [Rotaria socialis]